MVSAIRNHLEWKAAPKAVSNTAAGGGGKSLLQRASFLWITDKEFILQIREGNLFQIKGISHKKDKIMRER